MKYLTHTFKVTVFNNGKFCWKNPRWEYSENWPDFYFGLTLGLIFGAFLF